MRDKFAKALKKIKVKERRLAESAMHDPDRHVRKRAFSSITDNASYAHIALKAPKPGLRSAAVDLVADDLILGHIALMATDADVRNLAVGKIEDQELLGYLATASDDSKVRARAEWNAAGYRGWEIVTPHDANLNEEFAPYIQLARTTSCKVCGTHPAGDGAAAVLQANLATDSTRVSGVCGACTAGLNKRDIVDAVQKAGA